MAVSIPILNNNAYAQAFVAGIPAEFLCVRRTLPDLVAILRLNMSRPLQPQERLTGVG